MRINHNIAAMNTYNKLTANTAATSKSLEKLSSGLKINRASDNAAGLAISEKMRAQVRGLDQANTNSQDGVSLIQTAEGALNETHSILQRMRELAVQSSTDTNTNDDRAKIQSEIDELAKEITRVSNTTEFNTKNLLAGGLSTTFHIGANENQNMTMSIAAMDAFSLGVADSQVVAGTFTAGASGIAGTSNFGRGLTDQTYKITTVENEATVAALNNASGMHEPGTITGTFTGDTNVSYQIRVDSQNAGAVTGFSYSTDNGTSWTGVASNTGSIGNGLTWTAGTGGTYDATDVNKIVTSTATAASYTAQLFTAGDVAVGSAVTVNYSATSAVIGNSSTGETMQVSFLSGGLNDATDATQVISSVGSNKASIGADGSVSAEANVVAGVDVSSQSAANSAITTIDDAIKMVSTARAQLGSIQSRLEHTSNNLSTSSENLSAAESRVRDVDMAKEMMEFTKNNILNQASTAMLAQANQQPQGVLQLLQ